MEALVTGLICPTGKSATSCAFCLVQPQLKKYFCFSEIKSVVYPRHPVPQRGVSRSSRTLVQDAVDAGGAKDESVDLRTAKSCGPDAPTLASSRRKQFCR